MYYYYLPACLRKGMRLYIFLYHIFNINSFIHSHLISFYFILFILLSKTISNILFLLFISFISNLVIFTEIKLFFLLLCKKLFYFVLHCICTFNILYYYLEIYFYIVFEFIAMSCLHFILYICLVSIHLF